MKAGDLYTLNPWTNSGIIRTDDMTTDNMEYLSIGHEVPVLLLERIENKEYFQFWKVLVQETIGWVHQSILISHYHKIGTKHESR